MLANEARESAMPETDDGFGARLSLAMKLLNISHGALASAARADKSLVSRWARGMTTPRGPYLAVLTEIIHARAPRFTQLTWDLPLDEFARVISDEAPTAVAPPPPAAAAPVSRRVLIAAGAGAVVLGGGAWLWLGRKSGDRDVPASVAPLMVQAQAALGQMTVEGDSQAVGLYRKVAVTAPDYADGWGALAYAYATASHSRSAAEAVEMAVRARDAAGHASALDPGNPYAPVALALLQPRLGHWREVETALRSALAKRPDHEEFLAALGILMMQVGRVREAAAAFDRALGRGGPSPRLAFLRSIALWSGGRLDEADRAIAEAAALYPTHVGVWFTRFNMLLYGGRASEALAIANDASRRPSGIPEAGFEINIAEATAMASRAPADVDKAMRLYLAAARTGAGHAQNAIFFASANGRLDEAFAIAGALFLGQGFEVGDVRFSSVQGSYTRRADRHTYFLFEPPVTAMRADPRFEKLVADIGLARYWQSAGAKADDRK